LKVNNVSSGILYPAKLLFKIDAGIKIFLDKQQIEKEYRKTIVLTIA
jgi:hypothetical protein